MTTFIDTSILFAVLNDAEPHHAWAKVEFELCKTKGPAVICDIVYSEFSIGMPTQAQVDTAISKLDVERYPWDNLTLFNAGKAFYKYKKSHGGPKSNVLSDFLIGALAETKGVPLMTANQKDFQTYFPNIIFISP